MLTIIFSVLIISFLIFIHELGHFLAAKKSGMLVEEFGIGIPPRVFGKRIGETIYSINLIPFGGFVRIYGDIDSKTDKQQELSKLSKVEPDKKSFISQSPEKKLFVVLAGVIMNFLLGFFIYWGLFYSGNEVVLNEDNRQLAKNVSIGVLQVTKNSPAFNAGIKPGDKIVSLKIADQEYENLSQTQFIELTKQHGGEEIILKLASDKQIKITPRQSPPEGEGALGVIIAEVGVVKYSFFESLYQAVSYSFKASIFMFQAAFSILGRAVFQGEISSLSGPVGIINLTANTVKAGFPQTLSFMALISLNLAVFNLLPLPALDGGRIIFVFWELISKKPVPAKWENIVHSIGMILLLGLLVLVTVGDIKRLL
jgi:regulator of sigma E protease